MGNSLNILKAERTSGFDWKSTADDVVHRLGVNMEGKVVVITGANCGIGKECARILAGKAKADVIIGCRTLSKGEEAIADIKKEFPDAKLTLLKLDLASLASIRAFADEFRALAKPIHVLLNNAGVMNCPYMETEEGFEMQLGTNHLGHFALTGLLLPCLKEAGSSRVVTVSSLAHRFAGMDFDDLMGKGTWYTGLQGPWKAYGQSKTANILFAKELDKRSKEHGLGITAVSLHPGSIFTELGRHMLLFRLAYPVTMFFFKTISQGAATSVYCSTAPEVAGKGGQFFSDCNVATALDYAIDDVSAKRLWDVSEELTKVRYTF